MRSPRLANFLLRPLHLPIGPRLERLLAHSAYFFDQTTLSRVRFPQVPTAVLDHRQQ
jgi:hypothetical protein